MFSYFGSKSKIVKLYPKPIYPLIIEPFAGSARYACSHLAYSVYSPSQEGDQCDEEETEEDENNPFLFKCTTRYTAKEVAPRKIWLNDLDPIVYGIWKWIKHASKKDIRKLPVLKLGENLNDFGLQKAAKDLLGFAVVTSSTSPCYTAGGWAIRDDEIVKLKDRLLSLVGYKEKWKITNRHYDDIPNQEATWFIDPPYQKMGDRYVCNNSQIDYDHLRDWCQSRKGQVIVCEGTGADWLPFVKLTGAGRLKRKDVFQELVWIKE